MLSSGSCGHRGNVRKDSEHFLFQAWFQHIAGGYRRRGISQRPTMGVLHTWGATHLGCHTLPPQPPSLAQWCHSCFPMVLCFLTAPRVTWRWPQGESTPNSSGLIWKRRRLDQKVLCFVIPPSFVILRCSISSPSVQKCFDKNIYIKIGAFDMIGSYA